MSEPKEILLKHKPLFEWIEKAQEIPDGSDNRIQEIWGAFKQLNPDYKIDWCCGSCVFNMLKSADRIRIVYELETQGAERYTFPKQNK